MGKGSNDRDARASNFGDDVKSNRSKSGKGRSKPATAIKSEDEGDHDDVKSQSHKSGVSDKELQ